MSAKKPRTTRRIPRSTNRCNFRFADGRRCRMLRHGRRDELCLFHTRELLQLKSSTELGAELLALGGNFQNPIAINLVLGKLFAAVATGRMHRRDASTLAYIAQLLLQTIDEKKYQRIRDQYDYRGFTRAIDAKYDRPATKRSTRAKQSQPTADPAPLAQSPTTAPPTPTNAQTSNSARAQYPSPANPEMPEPLPDTPWFRELALSRRNNAHQPPGQTPRP
jgi:hypothetical protein